MAASMHSCRCSINPHSYIPHPYNILALIWKNYARIYRNPILLLFQFILPTIQVALFCWAVGGNLKGVKTSYVNYDSFSSNLYELCNVTDPVHKGLQNVSSFGELYVSKLLADRTFDMVQYNHKLSIFLFNIQLLLTVWASTWLILTSLIICLTYSFIGAVIETRMVESNSC